MTRFARAKGSKSSNERAPEDSTPWEVMKEQLLQSKKECEESKKRKEAEKQRIENYENFLKEHKTQKRTATWCDFPQDEAYKAKDPQQSQSPTKKKKNKQKIHNVTEQHSAATTSPEDTHADFKIKKSKKKKAKGKSEVTSLIVQEYGIEGKADSTLIETTKCNAIENSPKKKKLKKKKGSIDNTEVAQNGRIENNDQSQEPSKKIKNKNKKKQKVASEDNVHISRENVMSVDPNSNDSKLSQNYNKQTKNRKNKKLVDGTPVRRKPIDDRSFQLIINSKEVELVRFDGFPIMKKDADRLEELKKNMIKKGIPKSEVNRTLKLERRRAEKALARLKRDVCYNCRKGGHNLSDCPELKTKIPGVGAPDGVCFKCGSTEHRQFECKVQKDKEFRFATCFICKEPGHIARQCPDNPKGLYPNGGGCKLCGDVTHLRKDCPTTMSSKEETSIKLQTLDSTDHLEGIEQKTNTTPQEMVKKPKKIKF